MLNVIVPFFIINSFLGSAESGTIAYLIKAFL